MAAHNTIRVRQITDRLDYHSLVKHGIIPDIRKMIPSSVATSSKRKYPPFVYANESYSYYGVMIEFILRRSIARAFNVDVNLDPMSLGHDNAHVVIQYSTADSMEDITLLSNVLTALVTGTEAYPEDSLKVMVRTYTIITSKLIKMLKDATTEGIQFDQELAYGHVMGHPDIISTSTIYDVKNTIQFCKMSESAYCQTLAYFALSRKSHPRVTSIGLILPMQCSIIIHDLSGWDSSKYLGVVTGKTTIPRTQPTDTTHITFAGRHISKGKDISKCLSDNFRDVPMQMFLRNAQSGRVDRKGLFKQQELVKKTIEGRGMKYFTHATYVVNLCADQVEEDGRLWAQEYLNDDIEFTASIGGRGVVVHTGALCGRHLDDGLDAMEDTVRRALKFATKECPLLLETSAGEGTDVCKTIDDLGMFFHRFSADEQERLGVCIDTCHVFSSGICPLEYITQWLEYYDTRIGLVHFNESAVVCGACRDRHAPIGQGFIGLDVMAKIARVCVERGIPMVIE